MLSALLAGIQIAIPPPRGYVNDFAGVLDGGAVSRMEAVIAEVREKTRGEIVVVTLPDIGDRPASDVALELGREWKVGPGAPPGDRTRNLGVVVLLVPRREHRAGTGHIFIATGRGAEGFLTDAAVGRIEDAMLPDMAREDYGTALARGVDLIAQAFAREFGVTLDASPAGPPEREPPAVALPAWFLLAAFLLLVLVSRGRIFLLPFVFGRWGYGPTRRGRWGGGWRGGGWGGGGGGGGGFGGGFGGFGGGGGFSGGGAGRSF